MTMMHKYQHVERITEGGLVPEIQGLTDGTVYVFPKLDGANHCVWFDEEKGCVKCASRNQEQNAGWDSTGFYKYFTEHPELAEMARNNKGFVFYGEFLTPHTIRDYDEGSYGKWYLFDMYDFENGVNLPYEFYSSVVKCFGVECIPPICQLIDPDFKTMESMLDKATYLHGGKPGEGVVFKNYGYRNPFGRQTWGKLVRDEFRVKSKAPNKGEDLLTFEGAAVDEFMTKEFAEKEAMKLVDETGQCWAMRRMPELLPRIWEEFIRDFGTSVMQRAVAEKVQTIDMDRLHKQVCSKTARYMGRFCYNGGEM